MNTRGGIDNSEPWRDNNQSIASQRCRDIRQEQIARENAKLVDRLEKAQPTYRAEKWEASRRANEAIASRISRYTYQPMDSAKY